ncbi:MAG: ATP-dependent DNA helicase [Bacteroidia bacterium]|nr:MAG: ATP-dependent DNA helicase [Bacteroidia bacterium]
MEELLKGLNPIQREAVTHTEGPELVIAGAGSGKTRVLTYRIAYLLSNNVPPAQILALTFTNKAAREMKERIGELIGEDKVRHLRMGTFHSIFSRILRREAETLGYPSGFSIYDSADSLNLIKTIIKEKQLDEKNYPPRSILSRISRAKNNLITATAYANNEAMRQNDEIAHRGEFHHIYLTYEQRCYKAAAMDFDDLLLKMNILFRNHPLILQKYQQEFSYILIDEYQDTNFSQYLIIKKLAEIHRNICVVGDDAQSIYSFRGAKIENILNFRNDYKDYKLFKLEQNYRSTQTIVNAANSIIAKNSGQIPKTVYSKNDPGEKIKIFETMTDGQEAFLVAQKINETAWKEKGNYANQAILYRTNAQSRVIEESLRRKNIPYKIYSGLSFYQRKEIKDMLAYFRVAVNPSDHEALIRIINYPKRGIGKTSVDKLILYAQNTGISLREAIDHLAKGQCQELTTSAARKLISFAEVLNQFKEYAEQENAFEAGMRIAYQSGITTELQQDKSVESQTRQENIQELLNGMKEFVENNSSSEEETTENEEKEVSGVLLSDYLSSVSLLTNEDNESEEDNNKVTLMTIHSAKGLEFGNVHIVGMEEGLFPSERSSHTGEELEEERRLFYVAVTRAKSRLHIYFTRQRYRWGRLTDCMPSRFLKEIDKKYIDYLSAFGDLEDTDFEKERNTYTGSNTTSPTTSSSFQSRRKNLKPLSKSTNTKRETTKKEIQTGKGKLYPGAKVRHERFGVGEIESLSGEEPNTKAVIHFQDAGKKTLLLKFARLDILS